MDRLESRFSQNDSSRRHFYKIFEPLMDKPNLFPHKDIAFFASVIIKIGANFLFWLSGRAMLHSKDQVFPTCIEADLRLCFSLRGQNSGDSQGGWLDHAPHIFLLVPLFAPPSFFRNFPLSPFGWDIQQKTLGQHILNDNLETL